MVKTIGAQSIGRRRRCRLTLRLIVSLGLSFLSFTFSFPPLAPPSSASLWYTLNDTNLLTTCNTSNNSVTTRGHAFKIKTRSFRQAIARNHFCIRVIPLLNSLPAHVVNISSPILFKEALRNIDFTRAIKFTRNL